MLQTSLLWRSRISAQKGWASNMRLRKRVSTHGLHQPRSVQPDIRKILSTNRSWERVEDRYLLRTKTSMRHQRLPTTDPKYLKPTNRRQDLTSHVNQCLNKRDLRKLPISASPITKMLVRWTSLHAQTNRSVMQSWKRTETLAQVTTKITKYSYSKRRFSIRSHRKTEIS